MLGHLDRQWGCDVLGSAESIWVLEVRLSSIAEETPIVAPNFQSTSASY